MFCCFFEKWAHFAGEPRKLAIVKGIRFRMHKGRLRARVARLYMNPKEWRRD